MKSKLFLIWAISVMLAMAASAQSPSQQVTAIQYYFDSPDPGVGVAGNGLVVPVSPSADYLNSSFPIQFPSSPALTNGLHNLYVRAKDQNGSWSITERRTFLIQPLNTTQNVTAVEYYFDNDITGPGTQTPYTIAPSADVNTTINVVIPNTLSNGLHNLYVRVKDDFGRWNIAERRLFLVHHAMNTQTVSALEYYFDADPEVGMGIPLPVTPAADINQTVTFLMPGILAGAHRFYLRAKDNFGRWSIIERALDTAATGVAPSVVTPSGPVAFCQGGSTVLSTVAGQGIGLQWFKDGVLIQDSIFTTLTVTATGNYKVQSSYNGFTAFSNIVAVTVNTPPVITFCTADTSVNSSALNCSRVVNYNPVLASGTPTPSVTYLPPGHTFSVGTTQVVATATGGCTPAATCSFNVTVNDVQQPTLGCPVDINVNTDAGICTASSVSPGTPVTGDNCGVASVTNDAPSFYSVGTTNVTWTVTDIHNNINTCVQHVVVQDNQNPTITCPADTSVNTSSGNCTASITTPGIPVTADNCAVNPATNNHPTSIYPVGTTDVIWTVTDTHGHNATCTQHVTVVDNEPPAFTCPADLHFTSADAGQCSKFVPFGIVTANDNCGGATVANDNPSGIFPVGTTSLTWTATDLHGNTSTCISHVTIDDAEDPVFSNCPADITQCTPVVTWTPPTAIDNCGIATITSNHNPGETFPIGFTYVNYIATDVHGNSHHCIFSVTIGTSSTPTITASGSTSLCPGESVTLTSSAGNSYLWSTGATTQAITVQNAGSYSVAVTTNGCSATSAVTTVTVSPSHPTLQWQKSLGGTNSEEALSIKLTSDGGYIVAGISTSNNGDVTGNHGSADYWIVKLNSSGTIQWQKSLGGSGDDIANFIQQTSDGGYIVAGYSSSNNGDVTGNHGGADYWIVKLNNSGTVQWQKSLGGTYNDYAKSIQQTSDEGYIVAGLSNSINGDATGNHGSADYWIVKLDNSGSIQWQKSLGGTGGDFGESIKQTSDGGYIVAGTSESNDGDVTGNHGVGDYWIVKLDNSGNVQWQKSLGGTNTDGAESIQQTSDGGYIVAGYSYSNDGDVTGNHGGRDYWIVKLGINGNLVWQKSLGGGSGFDGAKSVQQTIDGGYVLAGVTDSNNGDVTGNHGFDDYWIVKLNNSGNLQWQKSLGGSHNDYAYSIQQTFDKGYVVAGYSYSNDGDVTGNHGASDFWIVKLNPSIATSNTATLCQGTPVILTANAGGSYLWSTGATTQNITVSAAGSYVVTIDNCFTSEPVNVLPTTLPQAGPISGPANVCSLQTYQFSIPAVPGAISYIWGNPLPPGMTLVNDGLGNPIDGIASNIITVMINSGTKSVSPLKVRAVNDCALGPYSVNFSINRITSGIPSTPSAINGKTGTVYEYCAGTNQAFTTNSTKASYYDWTIIMTTSSGTTTTIANTTSGNLNLALPSNYTSAIISVKGVNCFGMSAPRSLTVKSVPEIPGNISFTPVSPFCKSKVPKATVVSVTSANDYTWTTNPGLNNIKFSTKSNGSAAVSILTTTMPKAFLNLSSVNNSANRSVAVTANNACGASLPSIATVSVNISCRDGEENSSKENISTDLQIFPNPAHQSVNIFFFDEKESNYEVHLLDIAGRMVQSYNGVSHAGENEQLLDLSNIAKGMYQVLFIMDNKREVKKLVIE